MKITLADDSELHEWVIVMDGPASSPYAVSFLFCFSNLLCIFKIAQGYSVYNIN